MKASPGLRIGTAGVPTSAKNRSSVAGVRRARELGLSCMELEFVNGVRMGEATALEVAAAARECDVQLTVHAPYFINLNSAEPRIRASSLERLFQTARIGALCGAKSFTFHPAFYHQDDPAAVHGVVSGALRALRERLQADKIRIDVRPETTGKPSQYGELEEVLRLAREVPGVHPCVDFSHLHARHGGGQNGYDSFSRTLEAVREALGPVALKRLHMHVSGIEYGPKGEKRHLPLPEADFKYRELMQALRDFEVEGWLVCESPVLEEDALRLKEAWDAARPAPAGRPARAARR